MKKVLALVLALVMCLSLFVACGAPETPAPEGEGDTPPVSDTTPPAKQEKEPVIKETYTFEGPGIVTESMVKIPDAYKEEAAQQGTVEKVTYNNGVEEKYFFIYLPYGYAESDARYDVLFTMHGGNGRPDVYLQDSHPTNLQTLIDNMIQNGDIEPMIVVSPTWNSVEKKMPLELTKHFAEEEFAQYVLPLVDDNYRTKATRESRMFTGFSMGGVTTWYTFLYALDYVANFIPNCGDCWAMGDSAGGTMPVETVQALEEAAANQGYGADDFMIYCFTGTQDISITNLAPQIYAMQESDLFVFGENTFFGAYPDGEHIEPTNRMYLYNALLMMAAE